MSHLRPLASRAGAEQPVLLCAVSPGEHVSLVRLAGEVESTSAPALSEALAGLLGHRALLVLVDMREADLLDAAAADALLAAHAAFVREQVRMVVIRREAASGPPWEALDADERLEVMTV